MVGTAIERCFKARGCCNIVTKTHDELDLLRQNEVRNFFEAEKPEGVILAAAKVGGIMANMKAPAEFLYENLEIQNNIIHAAYLSGIKKLLFLGSSCIYPRLAPQPMKEEYLLEGKVEPTNEGYALAKITGLKMCEMYNRQYGTNFISVMPCNLYGPHDSFDRERSHVVPGLIRKFHDAKEQNASEVMVWGTGKARRELLYVDDLAEACFFLFEKYNGSEFFNIGMGSDVSIEELAYLIKDIVGFEGSLCFDREKPDGMPQKILDVTRLTNYGWKYKIGLKEGLENTYHWFLNNIDIK